MRYRALFVLIASGILGFRVGMVTFPDWQVAVETAQVTAGLVQYPAETPFFLYHVRLWTILHQVLAVGLRSGLSEVQLSVMVSGLLGMVSFQALSMFVFALSEDVLLSMAAPLLVVATRASDFGVIYPVILMGSVHTYGIIGLSLFVLVVALFGAGCYRTGAFLLGLAPSVHPSLGFWLWVVCGIAFALDFRNSWDAGRHALRFLIAGCVVTGLSLALQLNTASTVTTSVAPAEAQRYLMTFVSLWDTHRQPAAWQADGMALNRWALVLALVWLLAFAADVPRAGRFLLRVVAVSAVLSLIAAGLSWLPPDRFPPFLLVLMPARLANVDAMTFIVLLLGLIGAYRARWWSLPLAAALSAALLLGDRSMVWSWPGAFDAAAIPAWSRRLDVWWVFGLTAAALAGLVLATRRQEAQTPSTSSRVMPVLGHVVYGVLLASLVVMFWPREQSRAHMFDDFQTSTVFREAGRGTGLLLTGGNLGLIQLRTRRPLLINGGGLDGLPYAPESGPQTAAILRDIYNIDYFNPPEEARHSGVIPAAYTQAAWEQFTPEKWRAIRYMYQVEQVVTHASWTLALPVLAQDRELRLYQIPQ